MSITNLISYELLGPREEFAGWVSNISPYDTPFTSLTGKARVHNKVFEWQTDHLDLIDPHNAWMDGIENLPKPMHFATKVHNNYTQIFRKVVEVSDTANALSAHGRPSELEYQLEKATKEIKRDLEYTFLSFQKKDDGSVNNTRLMSGFYELTAGIDEAEPNTGAITHKKITTESFTENDIYDITENLYMAGSRANVIMFHPSHAKAFSDFFENGNHTKVSVYLNDDDEVPNALTQFTDPLGQEFTLLPNRYMDPFVIYFFHPHDWFQRVLRNPVVYSTDKTGSSDDWVVEMEVSLQHRNPWASGILELTYTPTIRNINITNTTNNFWIGSGTTQLDYTSNPGNPYKVEWVSSDSSIATVDTSGKVAFVSPGDVKITLTGYYYRNETATDSVNLTITPTSVANSIPILTIKQSDTYDLTNNFSVAPSEADALGYQYAVTSGNSFISVNSSGLLTAVLEGNGTVRITSNADSSLYVDVMVNVVTVAHKITWSGLKDIHVNDELTLTFTSDSTLPPIDDIFIIPAYPVDVTIDPATVIRVDDTHITAKLVAARVVSQESQAVIVQIRYPDGLVNEYKPFKVKEYVVNMGNWNNAPVSTKNITLRVIEASGVSIDRTKVVWHSTGNGATINPTTWVMDFTNPEDFEYFAEVEFPNNVGTGSVKRTTATKKFTTIPPDLIYKGADPLKGYAGKSAVIEVTTNTGFIGKGKLTIVPDNPGYATFTQDPAIPSRFTVNFVANGATPFTPSWEYVPGHSVTTNPIPSLIVGDVSVVPISGDDTITMAPGDTIDLDTLFTTEPPDLATLGFTYNVLNNSQQGSVSMNGSVLTAVKDTGFVPAQIRVNLNTTSAYKGFTLNVKVQGKFALKAQTSFGVDPNDNRYHLVQGNQMHVTVTASEAAANGYEIANVDYSNRDGRLGYIKSDMNVSNGSAFTLYTDASGAFKTDGTGMGVTDYPFNSDVKDGLGINLGVTFKPIGGATEPTVYHIPLNFHLEYR